MSNFTKSIVYSGVVLAAGLVAIFAIYNNMAAQGPVSSIEPASGQEATLDQTLEGQPAATEDATGAAGQASDAAAAATEASEGAADAAAAAEQASDAASEAASDAKTAADEATEAAKKASEAGSTEPSAGETTTETPAEQPAQ